MSTELDRAYEHCRQIARDHATNFYYAFRTLPKRKRNAIYATYAFCRVCDDIADEDLPVEEKELRFAQTREMLAESGNGVAGSPVFSALGDARADFDIPARHFEEVIEGVEMDLTRNRYETFDDLREYCDKGHTIFVSTHTLDVAQELCDRIGIIMNGELIACGTMDELENHTKDVWHDNLLSGGRTRIHSKIRTDEGAPPTASASPCGDTFVHLVGAFARG